MAKKFKKYPALCKYTLRKNVREYIDFDYLDKLDEEQKKFLHKFVEEYYCGKVKKGDKKALHNTDTSRKQCYQRNNEINRDVHSICSNNNNFLGCPEYYHAIYGYWNKK